MYLGSLLGVSSSNIDEMSAKLSLDITNWVKWEIAIPLSPIMAKL